MKITYRPEIDGLRTIAVVSVIFYHAQISIFDHQLFKGGFIGVDIFFVISGYLITSIILKELVATGSFSFKHFYQRRIRRILPVLLFVMLVSLPFAWMYLLPNTFIDFSKSILYSLGFSSNFYFWFTGQKYGAESGLLKPFLHTWSLSVEEQFYIIFPIVLLITFKYFRKYLIHILILGFAISLGLADWGSRNYPSFNFYILPTRVWELLAGSILAYFEITFGQRNKGKILNLILPTIGLLLIGHSIIFFNDTILHPSIYTLSPVLGVCLIVWFSKENELITKILSTKIFVGIGLISYSLYLWHYPIFAFARINNFFDNNIFYKILFLTITIFFSIISYNFIEKPARKKVFKFKNILKLQLIIFFSILLFCSLVIFKNGKIGKYYLIHKDIYLNNNIYNEELRVESWKFVEDSKFNFQEFQSNNKIKVLIIGDSHSKDLFNTFILNKTLFKNYEFKRYGDNQNENSINFNQYTTENEIKQFSKSKIFKQSDLLLISNYYQEQESFNELEIFLNEFKNKKKIVLTTNSNIYKNPTKKLGLNLTLFDDYLLKKKENQTFIDNNLTISDKFKINEYYFKNINNRITNSINSQLIKIAKKNNIQILYKNEFQCNLNQKICFGVTDDGKKIHNDYGHFTLEGAKFFGQKIHEIGWLEIK